MSGHHISSAKLLWAVGIALILLTLLTAGVAQIHMPEPWNVVAAVAIAVIKATIVASFFMNLYWDTKFNLMVMLMGILFFMLLVGITLLDTLFRHDPTPSF